MFLVIEPSLSQPRTPRHRRHGYGEYCRTGIEIGGDAVALGSSYSAKDGRFK
jgi:hypothetical protein